MAELHKWYAMQSKANELEMFPARIKDEHFWRGQMMYISSLQHFLIYTIKMPFTSPSSVYGACKYCLSFHYFILVCWLIPVFLVSRRSKIQICWKKNFHNVGFFDPDIIHEKLVAQKPEEIVIVIYRGCVRIACVPSFSYRTTISESFFVSLFFSIPSY